VSASVPDIPRVLLLTLWPPDTKYKALPKVALGLPPERLCWCSLLASDRPGAWAFRHAAFLPRPLHWRLRNTGVGHLVFHELQARAVARRMAAWARAFEPQLLWVLPELGAAAVGRALKRELGIPLHVTVHDAHETARFLVPPLYYPFYARSVGAILRAADSVDAICAPMLEHLRRDWIRLPPARTLVFPPSVAAALRAPPRPRGGPAGDGVRRIAFCGSMRQTAGEWQQFLQRLGRLPWTFEILAYAYEALFARAEPPSNVRIRMLPYQEDEADLIQALAESGAHAGHVGLWREPRRGLFARTSLSAKLTTYAAAGLPIVVDGPADSAAWEIVRRYNAGVLCAGEDATVESSLRALFGDEDAAGRMAAGAQRMCEQEFDLDANLVALAGRFRRAAAGE
jgi:hypothetical protein